MVKQKLGEILELDPAAMNYGLKTTMNSDEAVARGGKQFVCLCVYIHMPMCLYSDAYVFACVYVCMKCACMNYGLKTTMNSDESVARGGIIL
jgi:hypothetical protein